jgi:transposase
VNTHDSCLFESLVNGIPAIIGPRSRPGRPRKRPLQLHAAKAYDTPRHEWHLRRRGISCQTVCNGVDPNEQLWRDGWLVERTLAWFASCRRLAVHYEYRDDVHLALLHLAASLICLTDLPPGAGCETSS